MLVDLRGAKISIQSKIAVILKIFFGGHTLYYKILKESTENNLKESLQLIPMHAQLQMIWKSLKVSSSGSEVASVAGCLGTGQVL